MRIGIIGSEGRMGRAIAAAAPMLGATVVGGVDANGDREALARAADVLVDFSTPDGLATNLAAARSSGVAVVVGTTGLAAAHHALIDDAARDIAVLQTGNTSVGITVLAQLVREAAARLGPDWDIEIVEMHHRHKVDAPSGTALLLGTAAAEGRGVAPPVSRDRLAAREPREPGSIGYAALRGGSVAGDHQVIFATDGERIEIGHRAESRDIFARGAIRAARWLHGRPPGRYTMAEVLDL